MASAETQRKRDQEKDSRQKRRSDLGESGATERDVDVGIARSQTSVPDGDDRGTVEIGILKNRGGACGWIFESIAFSDRSHRFVADRA